MSPPWRLLAVLAVLTGVLAAAAPPALDDDEAETLRRQLEKVDRIRANDPDLYNRLKQDWRAFRALPRERQERIRQLDRELHQEDSHTQDRLLRILERYGTWLKRLPEKDRQQIESASGPGDRLQAVRDVRDREWVARLPRALRERVDKTPAEQRPAQVIQLRDQERQRRRDWRQTHIVRLSDFPPEVQTFVNESLRPLLSPEERVRLRNAEGTGPLYGKTILDLGERYRALHLLSPVAGPTRYDELPKEVKQRLAPKVLEKSLERTGRRQTEGKWPDYALAVTEVARTKNLQLPPLGPSRPDQLAPAVRQFLDKELAPRLDEADQKRLKEAEGRWPGFPWTLLELARKHGLTLPGVTPPGPRDLWEDLRSELPEVPDRVLRDFALTELTRDDHADLRLSSSDPTSRDRLKKKFFEQKPEELHRLRYFDIQVQTRKAKGQL